MIKNKLWLMDDGALRHYIGECISHLLESQWPYTLDRSPKLLAYCYGISCLYNNHYNSFSMIPKDKGWGYYE